MAGMAGSSAELVCDGKTLIDLETWVRVEDDDKQSYSYAIKFFELMALPSRSFPLERLMPLGRTEKEELSRMRESKRGTVNPPSADELIGEMSPEEQYIYVKGQVETANHASHPDDLRRSGATVTVCARQMRRAVPRIMQLRHA